MTHMFTLHDRIRNSTRDAVKSGHPVYKGAVAAGGAIAYALLDVAAAIRETQQAPYQRALLAADHLTSDILCDGDSPHRHQAALYQQERADLDQGSALKGLL